MPCWAFCINQFNIVGFTFTETLGIKTPPFFLAAKHHHATPCKEKS
nr:MAG TPA: hypothetical protein [Caudoviricetes sp.]DAS43962.1 MAG TPA: hypothetical protein [Caudoviricetes sp.]DAX63298.1 MAG TPA: hypothetical protein [Caudoviricetes sp.]